MKHAGTGIGGTPIGRSCTYEQRDNCSTLHFPLGWTKQCQHCIFPKPQNSAYTRKCRPAYLLSLCGNGGRVNIGGSMVGIN